MIGKELLYHWRTAKVQAHVSGRLRRNFNQRTRQVDLLGGRACALIDRVDRKYEEAFSRDTARSYDVRIFKVNLLLFYICIV